MTRPNQSQKIEQWLRLAVQSARAGILMAGADGMIIQADAKIHAMFGYEESELIGKSIVILVPPVRRKRFLRKVAVFVADTKIGNPTFEIANGSFGFRKDGTQFP